MDWTSASTAAEDLRRRLERGEDLREEIDGLAIAVHELVATSPTSSDVSHGDNVEVLGLKLTKLEPSWILGALSTPDGADSTLVELGQRFADRRYDRAARDELARALSAYEADTRRAKGQVEALEAENVAKKSRLRVLERYFELMSALVESDPA